MEIYNETIRDLLCPENFDLKIHEDKHRGIYVSPLREDIVTTPEQVMRLIQLGEGLSTFVHGRIIKLSCV
jgi:hypothetical protein